MAVSRQARLALDATLRKRAEEPVDPNRSDATDAMGAAAGLADAAIAAHEAALDPHPQYTTAAELATAIAALVASAPSVLDTLDELAAALGDDPNFATTITTLLAAKAPLASPALTGTPTVPTAAPGTNTTQAASTAFVAAAVALVGSGGMTSYGVADSGASAVTAFTYSSSGGAAFSLAAAGFLIARYKLKNVSGVPVNWRFWPNGDTNASNYYSNANILSGGGYGGGPANSARTIDGPSGAEASGLILIFPDIDGYVHWVVIGRDSKTTSLRTILTSAYWTNNVDMTDAMISCTTANGTGAHATLEFLSP